MLDSALSALSSAVFALRLCVGPPQGPTNGEEFNVSDAIWNHGPVVVVVGLFLSFMIKMWAILRRDVERRDKSYEDLVKSVTAALDRNTSALDKNSATSGEVTEALRSHARRYRSEE